MFNQILCVLYNWKQNLSSNGRHRIEGMYGEKLRRPGTKRKIPSIDRNLQPTRLQESERFWGPFPKEGLDLMRSVLGTIQKKLTPLPH